MSDHTLPLHRDKYRSCDQVMYAFTPLKLKHVNRHISDNRLWRDKGWPYRFLSWYDCGVDLLPLSHCPYQGKFRVPRTLALGMV
jgi:hypothetical protein